MNNWVDSFVHYIRYERGFSSHTVIGYQKDLFSFQEFVESKMGEFDPQIIDSDIIRMFLVAQTVNKAAASSVNRKLSAVKSFFRFLLIRGLIVRNPTTLVKGLKRVERLPKFVREEEMDFLLDDLKFEDDWEGLRDKLMINMFYVTGMRLAELIGLKDLDVDLGRRVLKVLGKRNKERLLPFGDELAGLIEQYRDERDLRIGVTESLFVRSNGESIARSYVYLKVKHYLSQVTTLSQRSPHVLRHSFATSMLNDGAEINSIKELMGHSSLASTEVYTHVTFEELKKVYQSAHPRALINKKEVPMKLNVNAVHFDIAKHLEEFVEKKVAKLSQYNEDIISVDVVLKVVKPESALNKESSIRVKVPQNELFSEKVCDTFEESIDSNVEALIKQLSKLKEKSAR